MASCRSGVTAWPWPAADRDSKAFPRTSPHHAITPPADSRNQSNSLFAFAMPESLNRRTFHSLPGPRPARCSALTCSPQAPGRRSPRGSWAASPPAMSPHPPPSLEPLRSTRRHVCRIRQRLRTAPTPGQSAHSRPDLKRITARKPASRISPRARSCTTASGSRTNAAG